MSTVPAGQRLWKCPECGNEVLLPVTRLDPLACDACLGKAKGTNASGAGSFDPANLRIIVVAAVAGIAMFLVGLMIGIIAGRWTVPPPAFVRPERPSVEDSGKTRNLEEAPVDSDAPDESTRPGPNYTWIKGYTRKDGVKVRGHWARDPHQEPAPAGKSRKK